MKKKILPKEIYKVNAFPVKIPIAFCGCRNRKANPQIHMEV
jgi:hypothetical protein